MRIFFAGKVALPPDPSSIYLSVATQELDTSVPLHIAVLYYGIGRCWMARVKSHVICNKML